MGFTLINLRGFRNLKDCEVNLEAKSVYLIGENGQGKTNFLEALYLLSYGSSFRTRSDKDMINWNSQRMLVKGDFSTPGSLKTHFSVLCCKEGKEIRIFDKIIKDRKELLDRIPLIVFAHNDFHFASGPPEMRRVFMDQILSLYDPSYVDQLRRYKKLLRERNNQLRHGTTRMLDHYSEQLADIGWRIVQQRDALIREISLLFSTLYKEVSQLPYTVELTYSPSWKKASDTETILEILHARIEYDRTIGSTSSGPHRDKYIFSVDGQDFIRNASTGQQRLLSLVLRATQAQFYFMTTKKKPLLLLDDVLLELDPRRRSLFRSRLPESEQNFYTFLPGEDVGSPEQNALVYELRDGELHEQ